MIVHDMVKGITSTRLTVSVEIKSKLNNYRGNCQKELNER